MPLKMSILIAVTYIGRRRVGKDPDTLRRANSRNDS